MLADGAPARGDLGTAVSRWLAAGENACKRRAPDRSLDSECVNLLAGLVDAAVSLYEVRNELSRGIVDLVHLDAQLVYQLAPPFVDLVRVEAAEKGEGKQFVSAGPQCSQTADTNEENDFGQVV